MSLWGRIARFAHFISVHQWRMIDEDYAEERRRVEAARLGNAETAPGDTDGGTDEGKGKGKSKGRGKGKGKSSRARKADDTPQLASAPRPGYDWWVVIVLVIVSISLTIQEYDTHKWFLYRDFFRYERGDDYWLLGSKAWWSGMRVFGYVVIPVIAILLMPGERLRDYYIRPKHFFKHLWIYVVLFLLVLPGVIGAAQTESFYRTYPFYKLANRSAFDLWSWEALYAVQFLALEFFFRGFMLHSLGRYIGSKAIFVMIVPYCMIHYGKPFPETMGAIGAGIILGTLAMRTRSIWGGVIIHVAVAWTMDLLALGHCPPAESGLPCKGH